MFGRLFYAQQRIVHAFFALDEDLSTGQLEVRLRQLAVERPDLAAAAAELLTDLDAFAASWAVDRIRMRHEVRTRSATNRSATASPVRTRRRGRARITVRAVYRPNPDLRMLSRAILDYVHRQLREERANSSRSEDEPRRRAA